LKLDGRRRQFKEALITTPDGNDNDYFSDLFSSLRRKRLEKLLKRILKRPPWGPLPF
jgi:hypothetical protein